MFLNPLLLAGIGAVSAPIIIHWLNRRQFIKVRWAAMRFLQTSVTQNRRRLQLEDLILLILRCLLIALVALALARPVTNLLVTSAPPPQTVMIVLDHSMSMGTTEGAQSTFKQAVQWVDTYIANLPAGSAVGIILASDEAQGAIADPSYDLAGVRALLPKLDLTDRASDILPSVQAGLAALERRPSTAKQLVIVTDGRGAAFAAAPEIGRLLTLNQSQIKSRLHVLGTQPVQNIAITSFNMTTALPVVNQPVRFEVQVANLGTRAVQDLPVTLALNSEPALESVNIARLEPGETRTLTMFATFRDAVPQSAIVRIPRDQLAADDTRMLAVTPTRQVQVLVLDGDPGREPRESESFYLGYALRPFVQNADTLNWLQTRIVNSAELETANLDEYDLVIMANVPDLTLPATQRLAGYVEGGGGLLIGLGDKVNARFYNQELGQRWGLLPAQLEEPRGDAVKNYKPWTYQAEGLHHPVVRIWNDTGLATWHDVRTLRKYDVRAWPVAATPATTAPAGKTISPFQTIASYQDGSPAWLERTVQEGRVLMTTSTLNTAWTDLPVRPQVYVPLLHQIVGYVVRSNQSRPDPMVTGTPIRTLVSNEYKGQTLIVHSPSRESDVVPLQSGVTVDEVGLRQQVRITDTQRAGLYRLTTNNEQLVTYLAVQPVAAESNMQVFSEAQRTNLQAAGVTITTPEQPLAQQSAQPNGREWTTWILLLAFLAAGMDMACGWYFSKSK